MTTLDKYGGHAVANGVRKFDVARLPRLTITNSRACCTEMNCDPDTYNRRPPEKKLCNGSMRDTVGLSVYRNGFGKVKLAPSIIRVNWPTTYDGYGAALVRQLNWLLLAKALFKKINK